MSFKYKLEKKKKSIKKNQCFDGFICTNLWQYPFINYLDSLLDIICPWENKEGIKNEEMLVTDADYGNIGCGKTCKISNLWVKK